MEQKIKVTYNGKPDDDIDSRIAAAIERSPLNFQWQGQGYNIEKNIRDISFVRDVEK